METLERKTKREREEGDENGCVGGKKRPVGAAGRVVKVVSQAPSLSGFPLSEAPILWHFPEDSASAYGSGSAFYPFANFMKERKNRRDRACARCDTIP